MPTNKTEEIKLNRSVLPDSKGHFGIYGGRFAPETLIPALNELEKAYIESQNDREFQKELNYYLREYVGRPTPLYYAERLTDYLKGAKIYLKREDLAHTGAHKINNTIGQALLTKKMGKLRSIAETGAGQHGVATATACRLFGIQCDIYMGEEDIKRQGLNVFRMELLGAKVIPVYSGNKTLKDAINEAMRDWISNVESTNYIFGSVAGPHPFPMMVRDFQAIIGNETKKQILDKEGRLPDYLVACVGGGSNSMGLFYPFYENLEVKFIGVEAAGFGLDSGQHAATLCAGSVGILHGAKSYLLQDDDGQIIETHSISAGLDYPGVGPEHSFYKDTYRAEYVCVTDADSLEAFQKLSELEGIIPALESAHAIAHVMNIAPKLPKNNIIIINLSGRGDKDVQLVSDWYKKNKSK